MAEWDTEAGASYLTVSEREVASTRHFGDLVSVDLDDAGGIVGIEVLAPLPDAARLLEPVVGEFPELKAVLNSLSV